MTSHNSSFCRSGQRMKNYALMKLGVNIYIYIYIFVYIYIYILKAKLIRIQRLIN